MANKALAKWDAELAAAAKASADQVAGLGGGGQFFSLKSGTLSFAGSPVPNNEMAVVVIDHELENVYYGAEYDPEQAGAPVCYAFGRDQGLAPHPECETPVSPACKGCKNNEFGSAERGKGKACKNRVRLACIPAGTLTNGRFEAFEDPEAFASGAVGYLSVPPTSISAWAAYVKQLAAATGRPPFAVFTRVRVVPDPKKQLAVTFELLGAAPDEVIPALLKRNKEQMPQTAFAFPKREVEEPRNKGKKRKF